MIPAFSSLRAHFFSKTEETPFCRSIPQTLVLGALWISGALTVSFICLKSRKIKLIKNIRDLATWVWQKIFPPNKPEDPKRFSPQLPQVQILISAIPNYLTVKIKHSQPKILT